MAGIENFTCHGCGDKGHFERDCPNAGIDADGKPPWCGFCDERTRLVDAGSLAARCHTCHPLRHRQLKQHRKCPYCRMTIYEWDTDSVCGNHSSPAAGDRRPEKGRIDAIIAAQSADGAA